MNADRVETQSGVSEAEFLRQQAEAAKAAIGQALQQAKEALGEKVDPRVMVGRHPIISIMSATLAGFVTTALAVPSKEQQELRRIARLQEAMHPKPAPASADGKNGSAHESPAPSNLWRTILHEAITILKPILLTAITSSIKAGVEHSRQPDSPPANPPQGPNNTF